jgi:hypothetical protein
MHWINYGLCKTVALPIIPITYYNHKKGSLSLSLSLSLINGWLGRGVSIMDINFLQTSPKEISSNQFKIASSVYKYLKCTLNS